MIGKKSPATTFPCFSSQAVRSGVLLLHMTTACNLRCRFCFRKEAGAFGLAIMRPENALDLVAAAMEGPSPPAAVEIGGPGEPLLDAATYVVLRRLRAVYPDLGLSVWTNGMLLPDRLEELVRSGLRGIIMSVNAVSQDTADALYEWIIYRGRKYSGRDASHLILQQQWNGMLKAVEAGISMTANITRVPGINDHEINRIESKARAEGAGHVEIVDSAL